MKYFIKIVSNKAKNDTNEIVEKLGFKNLSPICKHANMFAHFGAKIAGILNILFYLKKNDILFIQYPMKKFYTLACYLTHLKKGKVITLIHDLGAFRRHKLTPRQENRRLSHSDYLIVHNEAMKEWLAKHGNRVETSCLEIFDYLSGTKATREIKRHTPIRVVYAGGLGPRKNAFLYDLDSYISDWHLDVYGKGLEENKAAGWKHITYQGYRNSDQLIVKNEGDFGLVWDGDSIHACDGNWGEYLRYNNPYKTSFYIRCHLPVIIWEKAALAPFIRKHRIGICVESLTQLNERLMSLTPSEYEEMKNNVFHLSEQLAQGDFCHQALQRAFTYFDRLTQK